MSGHGHVVPNPDGSKARCGGPAICSACALELGRLGGQHWSSPTRWPELAAKAEGEHLTDEIAQAWIEGRKAGLNDALRLLDARADSLRKLGRSGAARAAYDCAAAIRALADGESKP